MLGIFFQNLLSSADFFKINDFKKFSVRNTIRVSNSLAPDQAWHCVRPAWSGSKLFAKVISRQHWKVTSYIPCQFHLSQLLELNTLWIIEATHEILILISKSSRKGSDEPVQKCRFARAFTASIPSNCQTNWIQIRPDTVSGLIWVKIVCKGYKQTTLEGDEFQCVFPLPIPLSQL